MTEARDLANQDGAGGAPVSFLEAASAAGIHVFSSASIDQARLARNPSKGPSPGRTGAQAALDFVRTTPGVGTALVGMKRVAHVRENLAIVRPDSLD
jgi:aryl-alcohol dehydrogenase-like predicted oxidoreductase